MIYILIIFVTILYSFGSYFSYNEDFRNSNYYYFYSMLISCVGAFIWHYIVRTINQKEEIYVAGLLWDIAVIFSYTIMPIIFFNLKFSAGSWIGIVFIFIGTFILKLFNH